VKARVPYPYHKSAHYKKLVGGNQVRLLVNGDEAFPAMLEAIRNAQRVVFFESYIFRDDETGLQFVQAFEKAQQNGASVFIFLDGWGAREAKGLAQRLRQSGAQVKFYHPITARWGAWKYFSKRNHRKLLVTDFDQGFLGGINIGNEYLSRRPDGSRGFRDTHIRIQGPSVLSLAARFMVLWNKNATQRQKILFHHWLDRGGYRAKRRGLGRSALDLLASLQKPLLPRQGEDSLPGYAKIQILGNNNILKNFLIRNAYRRLMGRAQKTIYLTNPYFIPDHFMRRAMYKAVRRGVSVKILLPQKNDLAVIGYAMRNLYSRFLKHGVEIFEWSGGFVHAKTMVVDGQLSIVGSFNLDRLSLLNNLEIAALIQCRRFGRELESLFWRDLSQSKSIDPKKWRKRPLGQKILQRMAYALRWWL
jgi:cardiolipin synthase